jgi:hypothetical protein
MFLAGCGFGWTHQFQLGFFCRAMVAMLQWLDARSFFVHPQLIGGIFLPLFVKVFCDRLSAHGCECRRTISFKLFHFGHFDGDSHAA